MKQTAKRQTKAKPGRPITRVIKLDASPEKVLGGSSRTRSRLILLCAFIIRGNSPFNFGWFDI